MDARRVTWLSNDRLTEAVSQQLGRSQRRRDMNILRRLEVIAGVVVASAAIGAASGVLVASTILVSRLGHITPQLLSEVIKLGSQAGASFGVLLGVPVTFILLRRVSLSRLALETLLATTCGGIVGFALSLPFAQPRPSSAFMLAGSCAGFGIAAVRLWMKSRGARRATAVPSVG